VKHDGDDDGTDALFFNLKDAAEYKNVLQAADSNQIE